MAVLAAVVLAVAVGGPHATRLDASGSPTVATTAHPASHDASRPTELRHPSAPATPAHHLDLVATPPEPDTVPTAVGAVVVPAAVATWTSAPRPARHGRAPPTV